jgi:Glycosyl hydrolase catalytic core
MLPLYRVRRVRLAVNTTIVAAIAAMAIAPSGAARPPRDFFGVQATNIPSAREFGRMGKGRVQIFRFNLLWAAVAPCPTCRDWTLFDKLVTDAARNHIRTLPVLVGSPSYAASQQSYPPETASARAQFLSFIRDAVARYGSRGSFWSKHRKLPRLPPPGWEVWNEPNLSYFWNGSPDASDYVSLLKLARGAVRSRDPRAKIVLAGVTNSRAWSIDAWTKALYRVPGFASSFDVLAIHPYAAGWGGILTAARDVTGIARAHQDGRKPLWITETGWSTGGPPGYFTTSLKGQAKLLSATFSALLRHRKQLNLRMIIWFQWRDRALNPGEPDWWEPHTGLFGLNGRAKPAWRAYVRFTSGHPGRGRVR